MHTSVAPWGKAKIPQSYPPNRLSGRRLKKRNGVHHDAYRKPIVNARSYLSPKQQVIASDLFKKVNESLRLRYLYLASALEFQHTGQMCPCVHLEQKKNQNRHASSVHGVFLLCLVVQTAEPCPENWIIRGRYRWQFDWLITRYVCTSRLDHEYYSTKHESPRER